MNLLTQVAVTATTTVTSRPGSVVASEGLLSASVGGYAVTSTATATTISTSQHVLSSESSVNASVGNGDRRMQIEATAIIQSRSRHHHKRQQ